MWFYPFVPVVFSGVGFVITMLGLFAGYTPGFMEDYQVLVLNTSVLGRNYVSELNNDSSSSDKRALMPAIPIVHATVVPAPFLDADAATVTAAPTATGHERRMRARKEATTTTTATGKTLASATAELAELSYDEAADKMAAILGISEFYSLHVLNACEGGYAPNVTVVGSWRNVSNCTSQIGLRQLNLSGLLDDELRATLNGSHSGLEALGASSSLLNALNRIPTIGMAVAVFYIVAAIGNGLGVLVALAAVVVHAQHPRETVLAGLGTASGAALALLVAALVVLVAAGSAVDSINRLGLETFGMEAIKGTAFCNLTWAAFALNLLTAAYWGYRMRQDAQAAAAAAAAAKAAAAAAAAAAAKE